MKRALRVAVTRDEGPEGALTKALAARGLEPVACPVTATGPSPEPGRLTDAASHLGRYDWLVVASGRGLGALMEARAGAPLPAGLRTAAVGARTKALLEAHGARGVLTAPDPGALALIEALRGADAWAGRAALIPRALDGSPELGEALRGMGAQVDEIPAYRTIERPASEVATAWAAARADAVVVASPSAARALIGGVGAETLARLAAVVAIGPTTRAALETLGVSARVAPHADFDSVADLLARSGAMGEVHP